MILQCPKCKARHEVADRKPGETFSCSCGNVLAAPKKSGMTWVIVLVIVVVAAVPCLGILAAIAIPNFIKYQQRAKASEARMNVRAIATAQVVYFGTNETFVAAGPVPATVPGAQRVPFTPDEGFQQLGWSTEPVRYQYEVRLAGPKKATIIARGDLDGDGQFSEFKVELDGASPPGPVQATNETE